MLGERGGYRSGMAANAVSLERAWARRALLVLQAPRAVFAALRDDSDEAAQARQEPVLALAWLAGIGGVLASPVARTLLDDPARDGLVVAVWAFIGGGIYAAFVLWVGGALVHGALRALGGHGTYRRARHLLAFASAPLALSLLVLWPIALAAFGGDLFRSGGSDSGAGGALLIWAEIAFGAWSLALLGVGIRTVEGWTWGRSAAAVVAAAAPLAALAALQAVY
jgi:hypothetical protein